MATLAPPDADASFLEEFQVSAERGFLPAPDPLARLPVLFEIWEEIAAEMPKLLAAGQLRTVLDTLPALDTSTLEDVAELERAMLLLSYFGHGYVWGESPAKDRIPAGVAVTWHEVAKRLGRPPVLSYASYALHNWRRLEPSGSIALGNIVLLQNFLGGVDEEWFVLVHVEIEAKAGNALAAAVKALTAAQAGDASATSAVLEELAADLVALNATLARMPEKCDPYVYFNRVRPYIHGWKNNPSLPKGVVYEGVEAYGGQPQQFRGETGAQSSIVPSLDAALGVRHANDPLREYLAEMRDYMPVAHRAFIAKLEEPPSVGDFVRGAGDAKLQAAYDRCLEELARFREKHLEYAARYIQQQNQRSRSNPNSVGTGGTPFMRYLKKHLVETRAGEAKPPARRSRKPKA